MKKLLRLSISNLLLLPNLESKILQEFQTSPEKAGLVGLGYYIYVEATEEEVLVLNLKYGIELMRISDSLMKSILSHMDEVPQ